MLLTARQHQQPTFAGQQIARRQQTVRARRQRKLTAGTLEAGMQARRRRIDRHVDPAVHTHKAVLHRQGSMRCHALLR